ncbi:MAG: G1 family glutamic endopeptidase [Thermoleophilia bacterium]
MAVTSGVHSIIRGGAAAVLALLIVAWLPSAAAATLPLGHTHPILGAAGSSTNWAGYDATDDVNPLPFTSVTATWTQPKIVSLGTVEAYADFWVGLDGDSGSNSNPLYSSTVEQIGTEGYVQGGMVLYDAWYEMYPAPPVTIPMIIRPGDVLTGSVVANPISAPAPATFTLSLVDHTTGVSFTKTTLVPSGNVAHDYSAEVITEAPWAGGVLPLANFGLVNFSACAFNGSPISAFNWSQISMASDLNVPEANTSALGSDGASFFVTSDVTPPVTKVAGAGSLWHSKPVPLTFTAIDNPGGQGVAYTEYSLDNGATWTKGTSLVIPAPRDHANDGTHKILYRSADKVGNLERARICTVNIDTRQPTPIANWLASVVRGHTASLLYYISDPRPGSPTATVMIRVCNAADRLVKKVVGTVPVNKRLAASFYCTLPAGTYHFYIYATDQAGNAQTRVGRNLLLVRNTSVLRTTQIVR